MNFFLASLRTSLKLLLQKKIYYAVFITGAILILLVYGAAGDDILTLKTGFCYNPQSQIGAQMYQVLLKEKDLEIIYYEDSQQMSRDVAAGRLECAYILDDQADSRVLDGQLEGILTRIVSPATMAKPIADEMVNAALSESMTAGYAANYLSQIMDIPFEACVQEATEEVQYYYDADIFLKANYENGAIEKQGAFRKADRSIYQGIVAVLAMLVMYILLLNTLDLKVKGICRKMDTKDRRTFLLAQSFASGLYGFLLAYALMLILNCTAISSTGLYAALLLGGYLCLLSGLHFICALLFKNSQFLYGVFPIVAAASFLFGGSFYDLGSIHPYLGVLEKLFPSTYYLQLLSL